MESLSFWSEDSEELFRRYKIIEPELRNGYDLLSILDGPELCDAGYPGLWDIKYLG
jgi:hypothetical protein